MDQRLSFWLNVQKPKARVAKIMQLFCAFLLRRTLRLGALLRPKKLLNGRCKRQRSRGTTPCRALSGTKSRSTICGCLITRGPNSVFLSEGFKRRDSGKLPDKDETVPKIRLITRGGMMNGQ